MFGRSGGENISAETQKIVNDLRSLCSGVFLFQSSHDRRPLPGEEVSLDIYLDRPMVTDNSGRYKNVMLSEEVRVASGDVHQYVGVELFLESTGTRKIQKRLALWAEGRGLFQEIKSGDVTSFEPYKSGLKVFMRVPNKLANSSF